MTTTTKTTTKTTKTTKATTTTTKATAAARGKAKAPAKADKPIWQPSNTLKERLAAAAAADRSGRKAWAMLIQAIKRQKALAAALDPDATKTTKDASAAAKKRAAEARKVLAEYRKAAEEAYAWEKHSSDPGAAWRQHLKRVRDSLFPTRNGKGKTGKGNGKGKGKGGSGKGEGGNVSPAAAVTEVIKAAMMDIQAVIKALQAGTPKPAEKAAESALKRLEGLISKA